MCACGGVYANVSTRVQYVCSYDLLFYVMNGNSKEGARTGWIHTINRQLLGNQWVDGFGSVTVGEGLQTDWIEFTRDHTLILLFTLCLSEELFFFMSSKKLHLVWVVNFFFFFPTVTISLDLSLKKSLSVRTGEMGIDSVSVLLQQV